MRRKQQIPIIYEDEYILVCEKPAGMPVQSDHSRDMDVETAIKHQLYEKQQGEEEPYLTAVHRLDRPVGGLMVFARTKEAAAALSEQIQKHEFEKCYQAVVCGALPDDFGTFEDYLLRDGKTNTSSVVKKGTKGAKKAILDYEMIDEIETKEGVLSWVLIMLETGRHHQIRVQMSHAGMPLAGDHKYGKMDAVDNVALCAHKIAFRHPVTGKNMKFEIRPQGIVFQPFLQKKNKKEETLS